MNEVNTVQDAGASDKAKLTIAIVLAAGGIAAYYVLGAQPAWMRWIAVVGGIALGVVLFGWSVYGRRFWQFVLEARIELRKVVWPTRQETGMTTLVVFAFVLIAGLFFWVLDLVLAWATRALTGQGG
ncbi:MAG: preprotein translocase subunit SecE [Pseudomonadota bacterium]|jgi:preprotein translocase, SecE subunit, bacterial|nr:MAG: preprotein translocase subunit SecE [Pseudomonadota bacterium]